MSPSRKAVQLYEGFHKFAPRDVGPFPDSFKIPREAVRAGRAEYVLYRSDKLNPVTHEDEGVIDYIHEHKEGVIVLVTSRDIDGPLVKVPKYIRDTKTLIFLGECLGFGYRDGRGLIEAEARAPRPELFTLPSGKALLVIQGRRKVEAIIKGGKLGVEPRGIVG